MIVPAELYDYFQGVEPEVKARILNALETKKINAVRINTNKTTTDFIVKRLNEKGFESETIGFADGLILKNESSLISKTLEHFLGYFYIQSVASMIPPLVLNPCADDIVLDIAAAPGSKTTQMAQMMGNKGMLVANEWDGKRIKTLSHNLDRMGVVNAALVNMGGERIGNLLPETFDKILVDAPCSALGVLYKAPQAVANLNYLQKFVFIQEQLLVSAIKAAKTGGKIVYSTCTLSVEENEKLIHTILSRYPVELEDIELPSGLEHLKGLTAFRGETYHDSLQKTIRLLPGTHNAEMFFIAALRKTGTVPTRTDVGPFSNAKAVFEFCDRKHPAIGGMIKYFNDHFGIPSEIWDAYSFIRRPDEILAASPSWLNGERLIRQIYTHRVGSRVARTRREGEWKLSTNMAQLLAPYISRNKIILTDEKDIHTFITAGSIHRSFDIERGGVVVWGNDYPLGCGVMHQGALKSQMPKSRTVITVDSPD